MIEVDVRGMRCPWPVLRLARAMRDSAQVRLTADDPAAAGEVGALCGSNGWSLERTSAHVFAVRNGAIVNGPFTSDA